MKQSVIRNWLTRLLALVLLAGLQPVLLAQEVVFVQDANAPEASKMVSILTARGYTVEVVTGASQTAADYATAGKNLLIADESMSSGNVGNRWRNSTLPVINSEGFLYSGDRSAFNADSGLTGGTYTNAADAASQNGGLGADYGQVGSGAVPGGLTNINIVNASHALAAGLGAGIVPVQGPGTNGTALTNITGVISFAGARTFITNVNVIAQIPGWSDGMCLFEVPPGAINADGTTNQASWIHLPWNDSEAGPRALNENAFFLFEAAVAYALGESQPVKIRDLSPLAGSGLATSTPISFKVDKVTASGSGVATNDIELRLNGSPVGPLSITDGGSTWNVSYTAGLPDQTAITIVAYATAGDGGFGARQGAVDTVDISALFSWEAEDFNFDGGSYIDNPTLCEDALYGYPPSTASCYWNRVGETNIDKFEINFTLTAELPTSNEVYRFGDPGDFSRNAGTTVPVEFVDTWLTDDTLVRSQYTLAGLEDYEVRNIVDGEWLNYTRSFPAGTYNVFMRVNSAGAMVADFAEVTSGSTSTNQVTESKGKFVSSGTGGYNYVQLTDASGTTPIVVEFDGSPTTVRLTSDTGGFVPNFFYLQPTTNAPNTAPVASVTSLTNFEYVAAGDNISVDVTASDADGSVTNVQVLAGPDTDSLVLVGEDSTAPYSVTWTPDNVFGAKDYIVRAVAQDDGGLTGSDDVLVRATGGFVVSTAENTGADGDVSENDDGDAGNGTRESLNGRWNPTNRNEVIVVKFDAGAEDLSVATDASLEFVVWRAANNSDIAHIYAVSDGEAGLDNNPPRTGNFTDNNWDDQSTNVVYSTTPGLVWDGDSDSTRTYGNVTDLGTLNMGGNEGDVVTFQSSELLTFLQTNPDSIVMFLIDTETVSSGQKKFASREATQLESDGPAAPVGWYAPRLAIEIGGNIDPVVTITSPADGATLDGGVETTITADASDTDGTIDNVAFYQDGALLGTDTTAPYTQAWTPAAPNPVNPYTLSAIATDNSGGKATNEVQVTVVDPTLTLVSTAVGNGADSEYDEENEPTAAKPTATELNTRFMASTNGQNECVGLAFDLSGFTLSAMDNVALNLINFRNNSARHIDVYGVDQGAVSGSGAYTTETWADSGGSPVVAWGDMPGLLASDLDQSTRSLNTAVVTKLVSDLTISPTDKGSTITVSSAALTSFVQNYTGSSRISLIVVAADGYTSSGQFRFASKEATELDGGDPTGPAGSFAPYLSFTTGAAAPDLGWAITGGGTGIDFSWTGAYKLQAQTNDLSTGLTTSWSDYPGGGTSPVSISVDSNNEVVLYRLAPQ